MARTSKNDKALPPERQLPADQSTNPGPSVSASLKSGAVAGFDRSTSIIEQAPESTGVNGYVVNNRRVAVQKELSARPPTHEELGVTIPMGARLELERTARQIAQYHPHWRIYEYAVEVPESRSPLDSTDQPNEVGQPHLTRFLNGHEESGSRPRHVGEWCAARVVVLG